MHDTTRAADALTAAMARARTMRTGTGTVGFGVAHLQDRHGRTRLILPFANLITDAGDAYIAAKTIQGIGPATAPAPNPANGMKLGTSGTTPSKAGTGAVLGGYLPGATATFAAGFPQIQNLGSGLGVNAVYRAVFGAGVGASTGIREIAIVTDQATNTAGTAATTLARSLFDSVIIKDPADSLTVDWAWRTLGGTGI